MPNAIPLASVVRVAAVPTNHLIMRVSMECISASQGLHLRSHGLHIFLEISFGREVWQHSRNRGYLHSNVCYRRLHRTKPLREFVHVASVTDTCFAWSSGSAEKTI